MCSTTELENAYNEVLQKIGRNLLLFQQAECIIKRLVVIGSLSVRNGESFSGLEACAASCQKSTMGQVAKIFLARLCAISPPSETELEPEPICGDGVSITVRVQLRSGHDPESRKRSFENLIAERNELVHHIASEFDPDSLESCIRLAGKLDEQRSKVLPEVIQLRHDCESVRSMLDTISSFLGTPVGMGELLQPEIQQSPLIRNLAQIAGSSPDPHGWTALKSVIHELEDFPATQIGEHCTQFGKKSISALLNASGLFETEQQGATETQYGQTFYRLKDSVRPGFVPPPLPGHPLSQALPLTLITAHSGTSTPRHDPGQGKAADHGFGEE
jgi:hypothetical protein